MVERLPLDKQLDKYHPYPLVEAKHAYRASLLYKDRHLHGREATTR